MDVATGVTGGGAVPDAVAENETGLPVNDPDVAVTVYDPAALPRCRIVEACPLEFVVVVVTVKL